MTLRELIENNLSDYIANPVVSYLIYTGESVGGYDIDSEVDEDDEGDIIWECERIHEDRYFGEDNDDMWMELAMMNLHGVDKSAIDFVETYFDLEKYRKDCLYELILTDDGYLFHY